MVQWLLNVQCTVIIQVDNTGLKEKGTRKSSYCIDNTEKRKGLFMISENMYVFILMTESLHLVFNKMQQLTIIADLKKLWASYSIIKNSWYKNN